MADAPNARSYRATKPEYDAKCQSCGWSIKNRTNGQGLAAQHADRYHHVVRVDVTRTIIYGPPDDARALTLFNQLPKP